MASLSKQREDATPSLECHSRLHEIFLLVFLHVSLYVRALYHPVPCTIASVLWRIRGCSISFFCPFEKFQRAIHPVAPSWPSIDDRSHGHPSHVHGIDSSRNGPSIPVATGRRLLVDAMAIGHTNDSDRGGQGGYFMTIALHHICT